MSVFTKAIIKDFLFKNRTQNLTTGNPLRLLIKFALPIVVGLIVVQLYSITDMIMVGRFVGINAFSAVGASMCLTMLGLASIYGMSLGAAIVTSQYFGTNMMEDVRRSIASAFYVVITFALIITLLWAIFNNALLDALNFPSEIRSQSKTYIWIMLGFAIIPAVYNTFFTQLNALGDSVSTLFLTIFASVMNIVMNALFLIVFKLGVLGVALATVLVQLITVVLSLFYVLKKYPYIVPMREDWRVSWQLIKRQFSLGIPMSFQFSLISLSLVVIQRKINVFGPIYVSACTTGAQVLQIAMIPINAISIALATFVAQNTGAKLWGRIRLAVKQAFLLLLAWAILSGAIIVFNSEAISGLFVTNTTPEFIIATKKYFLWTASFYSLYLVAVMFRNVLQGLGKSFIPLIGGLMELFARIFSAECLVVWLGFTGICMTDLTAWTASGVVTLSYYYFYMRKLRQKENALSLEK